MKKRYIILFLFFLQNTYLFSASDIKNTLSSIWDGLKSMVGANSVSSDYWYSFNVINGCSQPITVNSYGIKMYQGARLGFNLNSGVSVNPGDNTGNTFLKQQMYVKVGIDDGSGTEILGKEITSLGVKNDPLTYFYHTYEDEKGLHGEYLGSSKTMGTGFAGMIFNAIDSTNNITFPFGSSSYTVTLDSQSFNSLNSTSTDLIRTTSQMPAVLQCAQGGSVVLSSQGLNDSSTTPAQGTTAAQTTTTPSRYNYRVFQDTESSSSSASPTTTVKFREWGFSIGNFTQPNTIRMRDITPVHCLLWYKSAKDVQVTSGSSTIPYDDISRSLWIGYYTPGWSKQGATSNQGWVLSQITPGSCASFYLVRPQVGTRATLYVALLETADVGRATMFMKQLVSGAIQEPSYSVSIPADMTNAQKSLLLSNPLPETQGFVYDTNSGIYGRILISETFTAQGFGAGPYYYSVEPMNYYTQQIVTLGMQYLQSSSNQSAQTAQQTTLQNNVNGWVTTYATDPQTVTSQVTQYLQQSGADYLFVKKENAQVDRTTFNSKGKLALQMMLNGPGGISNCPTLPGVGASYFAFSGITQPATWASQQAVVSVS